MVKTRLSGESHERVVVVLRHCPRRVSNRRYVNRELIRVKTVQTSSSSCSPGGVFGREGATDSAARRPIIKTRVRGKRKRVRSFPSNIFGGKCEYRPGKELHIPKPHALRTLGSRNTGGRLRITSSAVHHQRGILRCIEEPVTINSQVKGQG